jgi:uncharacterized protein (TIGR03067 family)
LAFVLLACTLLAVQATPGDELAKEKESLQGTWAAVSLIEKGRPQPAADLKMFTLTIKGDKYIYTIGARSFSAAYKLDPGKKPKAIDVTFEEGPQKGKTMPGIYSLEGQELKICGGDKRPTEFVSNAKSDTVLFVFKRQKP